MTPTAHLLVGFIGSGKTTFAKELERKASAVRYTFDEWMIRLHGPSPAVDQYAEFFVEVEKLIWAAADRNLADGSDIIFDFGFWTRESREIARRHVESVGAVARFYNVTCPRDVMKTRTLERSKHPSDDSMWIDEPAFEKLILRFEPMCAGEVFTLIDGTKYQGAATVGE